MKYSDWNKTQLLTQQQDIKDEYNATKNNDLLIDIDVLESILVKSYEPFITCTSYREKLQDDIDTFIKFEPFFEEVGEFFQQRKNIPIRDYLQLDELNVSESELTSFVHDFFLSVDQELFRYFKSVFKERKNNLKFSDERSIHIYLPNYDYSYINVQKTNTMQDYLNIVHEYMHAIVDRIYYRPNDYSNYPFNELASTFIELLVIDMFENMYEFNIGYTTSQNEANKIKANQSLYISTYSKYILLESEYLASIDTLKSKKETIKEIAKITGQKRRTVNDIMSTSLLEKYSYSIAYITALELFDLYKKDPELCLYKLKQIISMKESENYLIDLYDMDIVLNDNATNYIKSIKL